MKVIIIGGGQIGMYMADLLSKNDCDFVIIEQQRKRYDMLITKYGEEHVIFGDGTSPIALEDAGCAKADVVVDTVTTHESAYGYDALNDEYVDMFKSGIVDPAKVTRSALENAASVGSMLLTTEAAVVDIPEEKPEMPQMPGGMGGMM